MPSSYIDAPPAMSTDRDRRSTWSSRLRDDARRRWDRLTDEELERVDAADALAAVVRARYGLSAEEAEREVRGFVEDEARADGQESRKEGAPKGFRGEDPADRLRRPPSVEEMW